MARVFILCILILTGITSCRESSSQSNTPPLPIARSEMKPIDKADIRILFIGNSHTSYCDLPELTCKMIQKVNLGKTVSHQIISVAHLEDASWDPNISFEIESKPWTHVVLQAQKISMSGKYLYSTKDGIALGKAARSKGAKVFYFSEWARKGEVNERERTEKIYSEMAKEVGCQMIPVGRAWDAALAKQPTLQLHAADGNHESNLGAYLTACMIAGQITQANPKLFAEVESDAISQTDRNFFVEIAEKTLFAKE